MGPGTVLVFVFGLGEIDRISLHALVLLRIYMQSQLELNRGVRLVTGMLFNDSLRIAFEVGFEYVGHPHQPFVAVVGGFALGTTLLEDRFGRKLIEWADVGI